LADAIAPAVHNLPKQAQMKNLHTSINPFAVFAAYDRPIQKRSLPHQMLRRQHKNQ